MLLIYSLIIICAIYHIPRDFTVIPTCYVTLQS